MNRSNPLLSRLRTYGTVLSIALSCIACDREVVREAGSYADGAPAYEREYLVISGTERVPHGAHATWYADGTRRTLAFFRHGAREGYAFEWDESGALVRLRACEADICEERAPTARGELPAAVLASTRFQSRPF